MNDANNNIVNDNPNPNPNQFPLQAIEGLEQYLERNGLQLFQNESLDNQELAKRIEQEECYKQKVLHKFLKDDELQSMHDQKDFMEEKKRVVSLCGNKKMKIVTSSSQDEIFVSLALLVGKCDTIYAFVKSDQWLPIGLSSPNHDSDNDNHDTDDTTSTTDNNSLSFSLSQFNHESTLEFISILQQTKSIQNISPDHIIECCKISHFLQCQSILNDIVSIIQQSIDDNNCASICILADELHIPSLIQSSMSHVMDKLDNIKQNDIWNDFPMSLKHHIQTLHNAAMSSIVGRGHTSKVLFTSSNEFLSIFFDTLREHKERLREAKLRQEEIIQERIRQNENRGRYEKEIDVYGGDVRDAAIKIEKQERRVQTLETFYNEQKMIFARDAVGDGNYKSSFSL